MISCSDYNKYKSENKRKYVYNNNHNNTARSMQVQAYHGSHEFPLHAILEQVHSSNTSNVRGSRQNSLPVKTDLSNTALNKK